MVSLGMIVVATSGRQDKSQSEISVLFFIIGLRDVFNLEISEY